MGGRGEGARVLKFSFYLHRGGGLELLVEIYSCYTCRVFFLSYTVMYTHIDMYIDIQYTFSVPFAFYLRLLVYIL